MTPILLTPLLLLILGLIFVFLEFYLPGAIMGTIGIAFLLSSIVVFAQQSESFLWSLLFLAVEIALVTFLIKYTLKMIPTAKKKYSIYLNDDQEGYQASHFNASAIGKIGTVITDLKPGGYILVEGEKYQAISQSGYISQGNKVLIIGGEGDGLIVQNINLEEES